jgi:regulator of RNase E activity RraA
LIDAAYGMIVIEAGESMEEQRERKKAEKRDKKMVKRVKMEARGNNSSRCDKSDGGNMMTIEMLVRDEASESLQLLIDAAYGIVQLQVGESMEEKKKRKKREKADRKMFMEMKHRLGKKQIEETKERI